MRLKLKFELISCNYSQISSKMVRSIYIIVLLFLSLSEGKAQDSIKINQRVTNLVYQGNKQLSENFSQAEASYRRAISLSETKPQAPYNLGNAYYNSGYFPEALQRHSEAAQGATTPRERHLAFHNLGNALMKQKDCMKAVEAYKNALRNDPTDDESRYNLAIAQECAKEQGGNDGEDDKDKNNEDKEQQDKDQKKDQKDQDQQDKNQDEKDGKDQEKDGKPNDKKGDQNKLQPRPSQLSKQQIKSLLEAMSNQEKKVQEKMNAKKEKGAVIKTGKDW